MAIVYQHIRNDNGNVFYVGVGFSKKRAYVKNKRNEHWHHVANKHGHTVNISHDNICREEACSIEKYLIAFWREALGRNAITNITDGGDGMSGHKPNIETRNKIRLSKIGKTISQESRKKISDKAKGRIISKETRDKLRIAGYKRKHTEEDKKKISIGNIGKVYSKESRDKIGASNKGKKRTQEIKQHLSQIKKGGKNANAKKIINTLTGVIYSCAKDAMQSEKISFSHFRNQINGTKPLITPLRYL